MICPPKSKMEEMKKDIIIDLACPKPKPWRLHEEKHATYE
jgi:hypothetical protein